MSTSVIFYSKIPSAPDSGRKYHSVYLVGKVKVARHFCLSVCFDSHRDKNVCIIRTYDQRTNGPVNAHQISGPSISTKHTKPDYKWTSEF